MKSMGTSPGPSVLIWHKEVPNSAGTEGLSYWLNCPHGSMGCLTSFL